MDQLSGTGQGARRERTATRTFKAIHVDLTAVDPADGVAGPGEGLDGGRYFSVGVEVGGIVANGNRNRIARYPGIEGRV